MGIRGSTDYYSSMKPQPSEKTTKDADSARVETLFRRARTDRAAALELKKELDRLGMFPQYEDRFLNLFKQDG